MKTIKRLNIQGKLGYFFKNIGKINDFDLELLSLIKKRRNIVLNHRRI